MLLREAYIIYW